MTIGIGDITSGIGSIGAVAGRAATGTKDFASILDSFRKAASQTPAERARDAVLKKHGLSEDDYQKLPASERKAIDQEVADAVKRVVERKTGVPQQQVSTISALVARLGAPA